MDGLYPGSATQTLVLVQKEGQWRWGSWSSMPKDNAPDTGGGGKRGGEVRSGEAGMRLTPGPWHRKDAFAVLQSLLPKEPAVPQGGRLLVPRRGPGTPEQARADRGSLAVVLGGCAPQPSADTGACSPVPPEPLEQCVPHPSPQALAQPQEGNHALG